MRQGIQIPGVTSGIRNQLIKILRKIEFEEKGSPQDSTQSTR